MVAVRSAHLNQNEQFELESWVIATVRPFCKVTNTPNFCCGGGEK